MSRFRLTAPLVALAFLAVAPVASAQDAALAAPAQVVARVDALPTSPPVAEGAATLRPAPVAATRDASGAAADEAEAAFRQARAREAGSEIMRQANARSGKTYMIVGGAAFLAGAIIGGDAGTIIMIGGAGLGIYGLYLYVQ